MFRLTIPGKSPIDVESHSFTFAQLCAAFGAAGPAPIANFTDDEGDTCSIVSALEFEEAQRLAEQTGTLVLTPATPPITAVGTVSPASQPLPAPPSDTVQDGGWHNELTFFLNGRKVVLRNPKPSMLLVDYLRDVAQLKGTKIGCGEGGCGACTVLLSFKDASGSVEHLSANSCLRPLCSVDGMSITTVEGIGNARRGLHPVQERLTACSGTQCGFCTPGWVMNMYSLLRQTEGKEAAKPPPSREEIERHFDGNLCRCTGYRPILSAFKSFAPDAAGVPSGSGAAAVSASTAAISTVDGLGEKWELLGLDKTPQTITPSDAQLRTQYPYTPASEPALPLALQQYVPLPLHFRDTDAPGPGAVEYFRPTTIPQLAALLAQLRHTPGAGARRSVQITCGNTSIGVSKYYNGSDPCRAPDPADVHVDVRAIGALRAVDFVPPAGDAVGEPGALRLGSAVTLSSAIDVLQRHASRSVSFAPLARHLGHIANVQVRNVASWAGNVMLARRHRAFNSDVVLLLAAAGAVVEVHNTTAHGCAGQDTGVRVVPFADFMAMRTDTAGGADEADGTEPLLLAVRLPLLQHSSASQIGGAVPPQSLRVFESFKQMPRNQNAHAHVNAAFSLELRFESSSGYVIESACAAVGGAPRRDIVASRFGTALRGRPLAQKSTLMLALQALRADIESVGLAPAVGSITPSYRASLASALVYKTFMRAIQTVARAGGGAPLPARLASGAAASLLDSRPLSGGTEAFVPDPKEAPVGQAIVKLGAPLQASGTAMYTDDEPLPPRSLHGAIVYSTRPLATVLAIDPRAALGGGGHDAIEGAVDVVTAADIPGLNDTMCNTTPPLEHLFVPVGGVVRAVGVPIAVALGESRAAAEAAARAMSTIGVQYGPAPSSEGLHGQANMDLRTAIAHKSFHTTPAGNVPKLERGDVDTAFKTAKHVVSGEVDAGAQRHFYFEPQTTLAMPGEAGSLNVVCATQDPAKTQLVLSQALKVAENKVRVKARRAGGGYGGKLDRHLFNAGAAAVAAMKHDLPVRVTNSRDTDFNMIGGRQALLFKYRVGFDDAGKIVAYEVQAFMDGGCSQGTAWGCMNMGMLWADNAYFFPNYRMTAVLCKTNTVTTTAMRAPGVVQTVFATECIVQRVAEVLRVPPTAVQEANFYKVGELTPYQQPIKYLSLPEVWAGAKQKAGYEQRLADARAFNARNRWRKRAVVITPSKYGMKFSDYKSGATVHVYAGDGSVEIAHGGCEIGQGIHTKVAQVAAFALGCPMDKITVSATQTPAVPNNTSTGGSGTSESSCRAMRIACEPLRKRLAPYITKAGSWADGVAAAAADGVSLMSEGWYAPTDEYQFSYFVYCAAVSEVELDVLTGEHEVRHTTINYDCGLSLNPAVDIGQIEGAFIMGLGYFTSEEVAFGRSGILETGGTWEYKPPASLDIPLELNVSLIPNAPNPVGVLRSKAVGEPPYALSNSVFFALREAIKAARAEVGRATEHVQLAAPATAARLQQACGITVADFALDV